MKRFSLLFAVCVFVSFTGTADAKGPLRNAVKKAFSRSVSPASVPQGSSDPYTRAFQSAKARAERGFKGHLFSLEMPAVMQAGRLYKSGVGFSDTDPNPATCLGVPGKTNAICAVVRGADGWYSTCIR